MKLRITIASVLLSFLVVSILFLNYQKNDNNEKKQKSSSIKNIENIDFKKEFNNFVAEEAQNLNQNQTQDSYSKGYSLGYKAFLVQMGVKEEELPKIARYTVDIPSELVNAEEESKGYTDGYHKASGEIYCPSDTFKRF